MTMDFTLNINGLKNADIENVKNGLHTNVNNLSMLINCIYYKTE